MASAWWTWLRGIVGGTGSVSLKELGVRELTDISQLDEILAASEAAPVAVFKHSTRCPISSAAYREVAAYLQGAGESAPACFLVKVIEARPLSNEIARALDIPHQSPQMIFVNCKRAYWTLSHGGIEVEAIGHAFQRASS